MPARHRLTLNPAICTWLLCTLLAPIQGFSQKPSKAYPLVQVSTLNKSKSDTVRMKAYVLDIDVCPPCPEGAICKPCIGNHFTAVDEKPVDPTKIPWERKLRVFTQRPDSLKTGKRYLFTLRFKSRKAGIAGDLEMVSFKPL